MSITVTQWLQQSEKRLATISETPRLDAEVLLGDVLKVARSHFLAWPQQEITHGELAQLQILLTQRLAGIPIAYLLNEKEFWRHRFHVTTDTLIPRPETELLITCAEALVANNINPVLADLGTGSGVIALSLAYDLRGSEVIATDRSSKALEVAKANAQRLNLHNVRFYQGDWCHALPAILFDLIISNPPYLTSSEFEANRAQLQFEPKDALVSGETGQEDLTAIIQTAFNHLKPQGYLLLEHGFAQARLIQATFTAHGYIEVATLQDLAGHDRVTLGKKPST
ncbi:MAG: peptide chain release factor N(5)-glutamine methyltransferase [Gammaproteobacteria bacterium]|nr:peptide chain release factor N(5)-glutamine methyltransferase [Gammaproteobacteria bacterium]